MDKDGLGSLLFAFDFPQKHLELHANDMSNKQSAHDHVPFFQTNLLYINY